MRIYSVLIWFTLKRYDVENIIKTHFGSHTVTDDTIWPSGYVIKFFSETYLSHLPTLRHLTNMYLSAQRSVLKYASVCITVTVKCYTKVVFLLNKY